jgi:hypothetical protein
MKLLAHSVGLHVPLWNSVPQGSLKDHVAGDYIGAMPL